MKYLLRIKCTNELETTFLDDLENNILENLGDFDNFLGNMDNGWKYQDWY